jgi:hypothetical protein
MLASSLLRSMGLLLPAACRSAQAAASFSTICRRSFLQGEAHGHGRKVQILSDAMTVNPTHWSPADGTAHHTVLRGALWLWAYVSSSTPELLNPMQS